MVSHEGSGLPAPYPGLPHESEYTKKRPFSAADFFADTPWLNVPSERLGSIIEPIHPKGRLLGGSSSGVEAGTKPQSKLAALAAARKKAAEEKKRNAEPGQDDAGGTSAESAGSSALLDRLTTLKKHATSEPARDSASQPALATRTLPIRTYPKRQKVEEPEVVPVIPEPEPPQPAEPEKPRGPTAEELTAPPSIFARTMLGGLFDTAPRSKSAATTEDQTLFT